MTHINDFLNGIPYISIPFTYLLTKCKAESTCWLGGQVQVGLLVADKIWLQRMHLIQQRIHT